MTWCKRQWGRPNFGDSIEEQGLCRQHTGSKPALPSSHYVTLGKSLNELEPLPMNTPGYMCIQLNQEDAGEVTWHIVGRQRINSSHTFWNTKARMGEVHIIHPYCRKTQDEFSFISIKETTEVLKGGENNHWASLGSLTRHEQAEGGRAWKYTLHHFQNTRPNPVYDVSWHCTLALVLFQMKDQGPEKWNKLRW